MTETDAPRQANIFASMKRGARVAFMGAALFLAACQSIVPKGPAPTTPTQPSLPAASSADLKLASAASITA